MDKNAIKSIVQDALENEVPASQIDLVSKVKERLLVGTTQQGEKVRTAYSQRHARVALVILVIGALLAVAFVTPQGRAFAQSILGLFIRASGDTIPVPTPEHMNWVELTPGMPHPTMTSMPTLTPMVAFAEDCGSFPIMGCSVEQVRSKVDFVVKEPADIPPRMYFTGATGGPNGIFLRYEYENNSGGLFISQERWTGIPDQGRPRVGASAVVEEVQVGNLTAEYYRGSFIYNGNSRDGVATWNSDETIETLRWVERDISYTLEYYYTTQGPLGKEGLVAIAESMTTQPVAKTLMPATPTVTATIVVDPNLMIHKIALAERQAGFKLMLPPRLPAEVASHGGASYSRATGVASVWFTYDDVNLNGVYLDQQIISNPDDCILCDVVVGDENSTLLVHGPKIAGANANLQTVQVGDVSGKYYEGVRLGSGEWEADPEIKHLRWQANGRAFELVSLGTDFQKEDLIAVAESLTIPDPSPTPDGAERWDPRVFWNLSLSEAEEQAGYKLILPSILPEVLQYFAAHYDDQDKVVWVHYELDESLMGPNDNGLVVRQQMVTDPSHCDLCDILVGDLNSLQDRSDYLWIVPPEANLETVQIGDVTGKYVEGNWMGTDCCGWVWEPDSYFKFLRWQKNGRAFELSYMGEEILKEDLIKIAENIK
jgi:hypothetical protein